MKRKYRIIEHEGVYAIQEFFCFGYTTVNIFFDSKEEAKSFLKFKLKVERRRRAFQ